uniref:Uncharacterized protein n=1 Tax=Cyanothece sp. (strain PCC 7425 / ATCC 29141) TaxID=395961 RepID=B8HNC0_CYAP4
MVIDHTTDVSLKVSIVPDGVLSVGVQGRKDEK